MGSLFDIIIWLLIMYFIFGGSKKKKAKQPPRPKQTKPSVRPDLYEIPREEPAAKPAEAEPAQTAPAKPARPDVKVYTSLGDLMRDMAQDFRTVLGEEKAQTANPSAERRPRRRREAAVKPQPQLVDECDYCTGEIAPASVFTEHVSTAAPKAMDDAVHTRTVETACRELGLSPMQQAFVWKEILDDPVALRK